MIPRIDLGPDFHAEPGSSPSQAYRVFAVNPHNRYQRLLVGSLNKVAIDAWRAAVEPKQPAEVSIRQKETS